MQQTFLHPNEWPQTGLGEYQDLFKSVANTWNRSLHWGFCDSPEFSSDASEQEDFLGLLFKRMNEQNSFWVDSGMPPMKRETVKGNIIFVDNNVTISPSAAFQKLIDSKHIQLSEDHSKMAMTPKLMNYLMNSLPKEMADPFLEKKPSPPQKKLPQENSSCLNLKR